MVVAIIAYDQMYAGLHGMMNQGVFEVKDFQEAEETAIELSIDVINDYSEIYEGLRDEVEAYADEDDFDEEAALEEAIRNDIEYQIFRVRDDVTLSLEELDNLLYNDSESFIAEYCIDD